MKLLIDECLSPDLAKLAQSRGYGESSHVVWLGKGGWKDWSLKTVILEGDWTFATKKWPNNRPRQDSSLNGKSCLSWLRPQDSSFC
jgi:hypothetical protein